MSLFSTQKTTKQSKIIKNLQKIDLKTKHTIMYYILIIVYYNYPKNSL